MSRPEWRKGKAPTQKNKQKESTDEVVDGTEIVPSSSLSASSSSRMSKALKTPVGNLGHDSEFTTNPFDSTAIVFFDVCLEFSKACAEVWPKEHKFQEEASRLEQYQKNSSKKAEGIRLAKLFHATLVNHYPLVLSKNGDFFSLPLDVFSDIGAAAKYSHSPENIRDTVWEYLRSMVQYAGMVDMYAKCPQAMLDTISGVAGGLINKLQKGELDPTKLNPLQLGQMMMQEMNASDLEGFGQAIMDGGNIDSMMSIMQSTMSSLGPGVKGMPGMPDMSMFANLMKSDK